MSRSQQLDRPGSADRPPGDDTGCTVLHVDMDAFYASVELRPDPSCAGTPVIVGGGGSRGVVLSATYEARRFGVHSAMPMTRARRLCPQATVVLAPHYGLYVEVSAGVMEIFRSITPLVEPLSLDEAFLDVAGARRRLGRPAEIGQLIRDRVADEQGITCSVGVASTKFVAKLASTRCKPDGLLVVPRDDVVAFLHPLPVGALWGVGEKTEEALSRLGLRTVGDIANTPLATLLRALGPGRGASPARAVLGTRRARGGPARAGQEHRRRGDLRPRRRRSGGRAPRAAAVGRTTAARLRAAGLAGTHRQHQGPLRRLHHDHPGADPARGHRRRARDLRDRACSLYDALGLDRARIRLVGVRVEGLVDAAAAARQLLLGERDHGRREAEQAADRAVRRFGARRGPPRLAWSIPTGEAPVTVRTERTGALSRSRVGNAPYNPAGTTLSRLCGLGFVHAVRDLS